MRTLVSLAVLVTLTAVGQVYPAVRYLPIKYCQIVIEDGCRRGDPQTLNAAFQVEIISDNYGTKTETMKNGYSFVEANRGECYSVRIYNPLPVRVAVNLTVDGLNSITGKPSGIEDGDKWMIDPYSYVTIRGWQVSSEDARRFFFTDKPKSYARWREKSLGKNLSDNCGVIGAAFFWNAGELQRYYNDNPIIRYTRGYRNRRYMEEMSSAQCDRLKKDMDYLDKGKCEEEKCQPAAAPQEAGTGMGQRVSNPTTTVEFNYNAGMYSASQAVLVFYDFAKPVPRPNPFPSLTFAPEM